MTEDYAYGPPLTQRAQADCSEDHIEEVFCPACRAAPLIDKLHAYFDAASHLDSNYLHVRRDEDGEGLLLLLPVVEYDDGDAEWVGVPPEVRVELMLDTNRNIVGIGFCGTNQLDDGKWR